MLYIGCPLHYRLSKWLSDKEFVCSAGDMGSSPDWEDPLEKKMATHSIILTWEFAWTEEGAWQATVHGVGKELDTI